MNLFPAIVVGGPPHAGKSVLTYSLSMALRKRNIAHYALRAAPDGEGDWTNETDWPVVERIRRKGQWTSRWVSEVCKAISQRHLPLLVDMGGRPTAEQESIFDQCTHAVLLTPSAAERARWQALAHAHNLSVLADLHSDLHGHNDWVAGSDPIHGTLAALARGSAACGPAFEALAERIAETMHFTPAELWQTHQRMAPWREPLQVLNFDEQSRSAVDAHKAGRFSDADIQSILAQLPKDDPICLYGRAPATAVAAISHKHFVKWLFDVRLGWVQPPKLSVAKLTPNAQRASPVAFTVQRRKAQDGPLTCILKAIIQSPPLDMGEADKILLPHLPDGCDVFIDGILPFWLLAAIARAYQHCHSITVYQPRQPTEHLSCADKSS